MISHPYRVAIIGAGTSGLAAAVKLLTSDSPRQISLTIYESRREAGGRTRSFIDPQSGDTLDNGQHLLMTCYTSTLNYLRVIGSEHLLQKQASLEVEFKLPLQQRSSKLKLPGTLPVPWHLLYGILTTDLLEKYEKLAAIRFGMQLMLFRHDSAVSSQSCADLFRSTHQPESLVRKLWEPIIVGTMNLPVSQASAQVFLQTMRLIFLQNKRYSRFCFPGVGLSKLLIDPAVDFLTARNCIFKYGERIQSVNSGNGLAYVESETGREVFDAVIYAGSYRDTPPLPDQVTNSIPHVEYSPIANAYLWTDKKIVGLPICGFIGTTI
ncbi:MAG: FAD-dependent oxidoreductase, partial [Ignavibacteriota bacterium]